MTVTTDFPKALREWRIAQGLSQRQLADLLGVTRMAVSNYERGMNIVSFDTANTLIALGFNANEFPIGHRRAHHYNEPFNDEEQQFAEFHHDCVYRYLGKHRLARDNWYDIVVFGYLHAVKMWFARPDLHKYQFSTIAYNCMRSSVGSELRKQKRRFEYRAVGLEENIPGTDGMTYADILCDPRDCVGI